jgi:hypothetical protein
MEIFRAAKDLLSRVTDSDVRFQLNCHRLRLLTEPCELFGEVRLPVIKQRVDFYGDCRLGQNDNTHDKQLRFELISDSET